MASEVKLPRLGQGMEAGTVIKWLKAHGDRVEKGEPLFEVDTDKVTQEVEADFSGVLLKIALEAGEAPVGQTIAWIGDEGEEIADAPAAADGSGNGDGGAPASAEKPARAPERDSDREEGRAAAAAAAEAQPTTRTATPPRRATAAGSRPRRSRGGSRASAESTSRGSRHRA